MAEKKADKEVEPYSEEFGQTLRKLRSKSSRTQHDVALSCNMSLRFYQDLEAGTKQPTLKTIFRLADEYQVSPANLLSRAYKEWKATSNGSPK